MSPRQTKVALVSPPWRLPEIPCLAVATLSPLLEREGIATDQVYGSLLFPVSHTDAGHLEFFSSFIFSPWLYDSATREGAVEGIVREFLKMKCKGGIAHDLETTTLDELGHSEADLRAMAHRDITNAGVCIERCVDLLSDPVYDIVGLSATFDTQMPGALAIARRLKARRPGVRIIIGGAACAEEQADGLVSSFETLDAVCHTEGEEVIVALVRALRGGTPLAEVAGISYRDAAGRTQHNASPPLIRDLDTLPVPSYGAYFDQLNASGWSAVQPRLFFETSRGCWWGEKHLCTFCGINGEGLTFRKKSPERAYDEIVQLYEGYPQARILEATDNILDMGYFKTMLPRLEAREWEPDRPLRLFYEVKSTLRREHLYQMARSGVVAIQPGIDSLHDGVLELMNKGCTGLGQIQFIKYATEANIELIYNLIVGNPDERPEWYREMSARVTAIEHLPPPRCVTPMMLERFSPYHSDPARWGITDVRPRASYTDIYPDPAADLARMAYVFDFDHPMQSDHELIAAQRELIESVRRWATGWTPGRLSYDDDGHSATVVDNRRVYWRRDRLSGAGYALLSALYKSRPRSAVGRELPQLDDDVLDAVLESWRHRGWVISDEKGRLLGVIPRLASEPTRARVQPDQGARSKASSAGPSSTLTMAVQPSEVGR